LESKKSKAANISVALLANEIEILKKQLQEIVKKIWEERANSSKKPERRTNGKKN